jgi:hypothetical protein
MFRSPSFAKTALLGFLFSFKHLLLFLAKN